MLELKTRGEDSGNRLILITLIVVGVLFIVASVLAGYFYKEYRQALATKQEKTTASVEEEERRVINKVKALYSTPNESPSIVQVQDQSKLKSQTFFKDAKNEDYVLLYQKAQLAILYRESTDKIINTGPISLPQGTEGTSSTSNN